MEKIKGKIYRISGPVVIATGLSAKMYDLVKVGKEELMGEVIQISSDKTTIQVYENTSGLKPGEPVTDTGAPLCVELGPGLLEQIYDGIQRPLEVLKDKSGDFIGRGISANALDYEKKWEFKATVKKGEKVSGGDVLGTVQETKNTVHKILVPPEISGKIKSIKSGSFNVTEKIGELDNGTTLRLAHKWPVRKPRPSKEKLRPTLPLITGQRILDTLFPLAKGGNGCIPGGFGTGKCVTGDTIILADNELREIKEVFEEAYSNRKGSIEENQGETIITLDKPLEINTFTGKDIRISEATHLYKGKTNKLIEIKTRSGRKVKLTPIHKLFKLSNELKIEEKQAQELQKGDYIISPRKIELQGEYQRIQVKFSAMIADEKIINQTKQLIDGFIEQKSITKKEFAKELNIPYETFKEYYAKRNNPTLEFVRKVFKLCNKKLEIRGIKTERRSKEIKIPKALDEQFAELLGYLMADGMIRGKQSVHFFNTKAELRNRTSALIKKLFELKTKEYKANTVMAVSANSRALVKLLHSLGYPLKQRSNTVRIPKELLKSPESVIKAFIKAYIVCDGHVGKTELEIATASKEMSKGISYLLLRLGVICRIKEKSVNGKTYYRIFISPKESLKIDKYYEKEHYFNSFDTVPMNPELFKKILGEIKPRKLKNQGISTAGYYVKQNQTVQTFKQVMKAIEEQSHSSLLGNALDYVFLDKLVSVKTIEEETDVYDITVPATHNFVGGNIPMILHNTVTQQTLSKWSDAQIVIYVACGERGNEITEVLSEFPKLQDPKTGRPLMERTILIANTSNMPVAAREASIYTGMTLAEYYRDQGFDVSLMADSTSRWAEAMREISSRLEEMPGEEGYPAYLASKLAEFYERAGRVKCLGKVKSKERVGSVTPIGAVSPPGGDFSEPVTQNTLKVTKVFWALDSKLAHRRHFPAINWLNSYSLYVDRMQQWYLDNVSKEWPEIRTIALQILQKEDELQEIVQLVGSDALPERERLILETAKLIREGFLQQNAFHHVDAYCSPQKQFKMLKALINFYKQAEVALKEEVPVETIVGLKSLNELVKAGFIEEKEFDKKIQEIEKKIESEFSKITSKKVEA